MAAVMVDGSLLSADKYKCVSCNIHLKTEDMAMLTVDKLEKRHVLLRVCIFCIVALLMNPAEAMAAAENPHWNDNGCDSCHTQAVLKKGQPIRLKETNPRKLCEACHNNDDAHDLPHASDIKIPKKMLAQLPASFRNALDNGVATCINCHDVPAQCLSERRKEKRNNPKFLRNGPYRNRTDICYQCHNPNVYSKFNPHDQLTDDNKLRQETCDFCHDTSKDLAKAKNINEVGFNVKKDLSNICNGCHVWIPHPGGKFLFANQGRQVEHLVVPPDRIKKQMQRMAKKNGIILPLDPTTGKVFCATCHNPHEKGVLKIAAADKGADSNKRLRMQEICNNCHTK